MDEKIYKAVNRGAVTNLVLGITILAGGITAGILLIISGARLLKHKMNILI